MGDLTTTDSDSDSVHSVEAASAKREASELQKLPPEMQSIATVMAGFFRSTSGPDPETARVIAESEMHAEDCKLQAYKASLANRDQQGKRDHEYRSKQLLYDTIKQMLISAVSIAGVVCGLYLIIAKGNSQVGTSLLVASFMALVGIRPDFGKDKS